MHPHYLLVVRALKIMTFYYAYKNIHTFFKFKLLATHTTLQQTFALLTNCT
jgi:hypothetical protein